MRLQDREKVLERKFSILSEAAMKGKPITELAGKYQVSYQLIARWIKQGKSDVQDCLIYVKIADEGKFQPLLERYGMKKEDTSRTMHDLQRENEYLKAKIAYYEELAKLDGIDLAAASKKNDTRLSGLSAEKDSETSGSSAQ